MQPIATFMLMVIFVCFDGHRCEDSATHTAPSSYKKVCYFTNWAIYRNGSAQYSTEDIDYAHCNFVIYSFASLDPTNYTLKLSDPWSDVPDGGGHGQIQKVVKGCNANGAVPMIALGGWGESNNTAYSTLFLNASLQDAFVQSSVTWLKEYGFKGLDLDIEYPQCPQGECKPGSAEKEGFSRLVIKLREEYRKHGFYLSAAVSGGVANIDKYYEVKLISEHLDWLGVMAYDYHIASDKKIGLTAPFFQYGSEEAKLNVKSTIDFYVMTRNVSCSKIVLGVPMYGVSYKLADKTKYTIGSPAEGAGFKNRSLYYNEICDLTKNQNWTKVSTENNVPIGGTYAYKADQWVGYDDVDDVKAKAKYIVKKNLGGYMIWSLDEDDFKGVCGQGRYPLLSTLSKTVDGKLRRRN